MFVKFGDIVNIIHKGVYAFVEYSKGSYAEKAVQTMQKEDTDGIMV